MTISFRDLTKAFAGERLPACPRCGGGVEAAYEEVGLCRRCRLRQVSDYSLGFDRSAVQKPMELRRNTQPEFCMAHRDHLIEPGNGFEHCVNPTLRVWSCCPKWGSRR